MATLCLFHTNFPFPSSRKPSGTLIRGLRLHNHNRPRDTETRCRQLHISASSVNKPRRNRRAVKSNEELRADIRHFLDQAGLPQDYNPSTKDFMQHGRNDLANIVRRRGYKLIRELLESSMVSAVDSGKSMDRVDAQAEINTGQDENVKKIDVDTTNEITAEMSPQGLVHDEILQCQDEKINTVTEESMHSSQLAKVDGNSADSENVSELERFNPSDELLETVDSYLEENTLGGGECEDQEIAESSSSIVQRREIRSELSHSSSYLPPNTESSGLAKLSAGGSSFEQQFYSESKSPDVGDDAGSEYVSSNIENVLANDLSHTFVMSSLNRSGCQATRSLTSLANLSLEEKAAKFVQDGDLRALEGRHELIRAEAVDIDSKSSGGEQRKKQHYEDGLIGLNGTVSSSRDKKAAAEGQDSTDNEFDSEAIKHQDEQEISHLKLMLHEKEVEFSRLKELIEKEKLALSVLQTVAETEVSKAQKLVSKKDAELHAAEESLSGLMEVEIQFCGDGDIVEMTGSFNGWHHRIKMDLEPFGATDPSGSRNSKLWSAVLWLYPGVYEIKFIVDGHWRIDPDRESVTRGHICNNILRVVR